MDEAFLLDLFEQFGPIRLKRMFGMQGIFVDEKMIGFAGDGAIYLKTNAASRAAYEAEGCDPFIYHKRTGEGIAMSYWRLPERLFDDPEELAVWARKAQEVANKSAKSSSRTLKRKPKAKPRVRAAR
jgi:DNA transformation protein